MCSMAAAAIAVAKPTDTRAMHSPIFDLLLMAQPLANWISMFSVQLRQRHFRSPGCD